MVDTCILSSLAKIDQLSLLRKLFDKVIIPYSVLKELNREEVEGYPFVDKILNLLVFHEKDLSNQKWILVISLTPEELQISSDLYNKNLSSADSDCGAIAKNRKEVLATDDEKFKEIAELEGIKTADLKTILGAAILKGFIKSREKLKQLIEDLEREDFYKFSKRDEEALFSLFST